MSNVSKVYFSNMRAKSDQNLLQKLGNLVRKAGISQIDFKQRFAAIKLHFGEPGNIAYLRPNYAKVIADVVKSLGGKPFLTDCNTLYVGRRKEALEHLDSAYENGYNPFTTGCHVIIADGLKGTDEVNVPVNGELVRDAKIGRAIVDADVIISLTHFKAHEMTGIGGAIKNLGMGCGSRAGKMEMHNSGKPAVSAKDCVGCGACAKNCAHGAISFDGDKKASINHDICVGCGRCIGACVFDAVRVSYNETLGAVSKKIAEYAFAAVNGKPSFHISLVIDVAPFCDCHAENDVPIIPDVGMFASFDPVALDFACVEAANKMPVMRGSILDAKGSHSGDHFTDTHPNTDWRVCIDHAEKLGIGTKKYELIEV